MIKKIIFVLNFILFLVCNISGLEVRPFVHSYDPIEEGDAFQLYIKNKTNDMIAFEAFIQSRSQDKNGNDILARDDDSFLVFPAQIIIPPNSTRIVKIKWLGNNSFKINKNLEQAFRIRLDQYPVNLQTKKLLSDVAGKSTSSVEMRLSIGTSLYITPKNSSAQFKVINSSPTTITVQNIGTRRSSIAEYKEKIMVNGQDLKELIKKEDAEAIILAGATRVFKRVH